MSSKLYLHIGTHKTGTTTIQHALRSTSRAASEREGWSYIKTSQSVKKLMRAEQYDKEIVKELEKEFKVKIGQSQRSSVISSEAFSGLPNFGYLNSAVAAQMLREITQSFDTKIIIYLRRQDDMVESMYTQNIHRGHSLAFDDFLSELEMGVSYNYQRILNDWTACFGKENVLVRSYHTANQKGLLQDFGEIIGSSELLNVKAERRNPSYSFDALQIALIANTVLDEAGKGELRQALQKTMPKKKSDSHQYFSLEKRKEFLEVYKDSNRQVANEYFSGLATIFPDIEVTNSSEQKTSIAYEDVVPLIVELLQANKGKDEPKSFLGKLKNKLRG